MAAGHLELSDGDIKKLGYQVRYDLLNYDPVLVANNFQYKVEKVYSKDSYLIVYSAKQNMLYILNFRKEPHIQSFI